MTEDLENEEYIAGGNSCFFFGFFDLPEETTQICLGLFLLQVDLLVIFLENKMIFTYT
jgi:hypothetical protein